MISPSKIATLSDLIYWTTLNNETQIFSILDTMPDKELVSLQASIDFLVSNLNQAVEERKKNKSVQLPLL